jgi:hypothetical protein
MPRLVLQVAGPADCLLLAGLTHLRPVIDELSDGALLVGGLATIAWLHASPIDVPVRTTRDVMKAALVAADVRTRPDRPITDTVDAVMLAGAVSSDRAALHELDRYRRHSEPKRALRWLREAFDDERSRAARRVEQHFAHEYGTSAGGAWAVATVGAFLAELGA